MKRSIPVKTIQRLLLYYRYLNFLLQQGTKNISSKSLADLMEIRGSQVRKDLSYFGRLGKRGSGYNVPELRNKIAAILGIDMEKKVCIIGLGNLGSALASYKGFSALGLNIVCAFDKTEQKIGRKIRGLICHDIKHLDREIKKEGIDIAILTVPAEAAYETAISLEKSGIKAILNFSPVKLPLSKKVKISNVDLAMELKTLSYYVREGLDKLPEFR